MQLSIYTKSGSRVINLTNDFFASTKVVRRGITETITPSRKAKDLAEDLEGKSLVGYELRKNNVLITESNMEAVKAMKAKVVEIGRETSCTTPVKILA